MYKSILAVMTSSMSFLVGYSQAAALLEAKPNFIAAVGPSMLIAGDEDGMVWMRNRKENAPWNKLTLVPDGAPYVLNTIRCAENNSGMCAIQFTANGVKDIKLILVSEKNIPPLTLKGVDQQDWSIQALPDAQNLYFTKPAVDGVGSDLFVYTTFDENYTRVDRIKHVGRLSADEVLFLANIGKTLTPLAQKEDGTLRIISETDSAAFRWNFSDYAVVSDWGILDAEPWAIDNPTIADARTVRLVTFSRSTVDTGLKAQASPSTIDVRGVVVASSPTSGEIVVPSSLAIDGVNDVMALTVGPSSKSLSLMCKTKAGQYVFKPLIALRGNETPTIIASKSGMGFVISTPSLVTSPKIEVISPSLENYGWAYRTCDNTTFSRLDAGVNITSNSERFMATDHSAKSSDTNVVPYGLVTPTGGAPESAIINVYGAYGLQVGQSFFGQRTAQFLYDHKTASAFPLVRGDGNLGLAYAVASRTPNRQKAVDDVIAVAEDLIEIYPALKGKIIVRGGSAGAWLAVKTVLSRPDLFSGAIASAGPYLLKNAPYSEGGARFFSAQDDLSSEITALKNACPRLHFRFIHAKDDLRVGYAQARKFADLVEAAGCPVEFVSHDTGGHFVQIPLGDPKTYDEAIRVNFAPF